MSSNRKCLFALTLALCTILLSCSVAVFSQTWLNKQDASPGGEIRDDNPDVHFRVSDHFRLRWGKNNVSGITVDEDFVQLNLQHEERHWKIMHSPIVGNPNTSETLGFPSPSVLWSVSDGNNYRANWRLSQTFGDPNDGGAGGSVDDGIATYGMGPWAMAPYVPTTVPSHEYGHGILIAMKGLNNTPYDGMWHEGWANFSEEQLANDLNPWNMLWCHSFFLPHGRDYYDSWVFWEHIRETPGYGPGFLSTVFQQNHGDQSLYGSSEYVFDGMTRLDTSGAVDKQNAIKDIVGKYARKNITWDYERGDMMRQYGVIHTFSNSLADEYRRIITEPVKETGSSTVYRVPFDQAPSQGGYVIIPITLTGKSGGAYNVSVNFMPLNDGIRQTDFRASFVAVSNNGDARYSSMWNTGTNTITLSADENKLYLVVASTPSFLGDTGRQFLYQPAVAPQAFEFSLVNTTATIAESVPTQSHTGMHQHSNGLGWVSDTATVNSTAYVGPNAMVLDYAQVLNNARVEDYAVVRDSAIVKDNAVISGHALVKESAQVYGYGKVRDWANLYGNAKVYDYAKVLEHASVFDNCSVYGNATEKGIVADFGTISVNGYAIKDGDCANGANLDHGVLMCWVWGADQAFADSQPDTGGLYAGYDFEKASPIYAMDTYGITHGYLMGGATKVKFSDTNRNYALSLNGSTNYVELRGDVNDFEDTTIAMWVKWTGSANDQRIFSFGDGANKYMYLTPKDTTNSKVKFVISNNGTSGEQTLVGTAAIPANSWTHVAITFSGNTGTLYVNGASVATNASMTLNPDDVRGANTSAAGQYNFLGKGPAGSFFQGYIDNFKIYALAQNSTVITTLANAFSDRASGTVAETDTAAPTPTTATWLVAPTAVSESSITMSANKGTDAGGNGVLYSFTCTAGGGHSSGWISANKYTDNGLTAGTQYTYTVQMKDHLGNTGTASSGSAATTTASDTAAPTPNPATFAVAPIGVDSSSIYMKATKGSDANALIEYKFTGSNGHTSGWQASPVWTDTGLAANATATYTVQMRDGKGNTGTASGSSATATARDDMAPTVTPVARAVWQGRPYVRTDGTLWMRARAASDPSGVQYQFQCIAGGGPSSGWQDSNEWGSTTPVALGTYTYQYRVRDKSTQSNTSAYMGTIDVVVSATNSYQSATFAQLTTLPDHSLVKFNGLVLRANTSDYLVKDLASNSTITVESSANLDATDPANVLKVCEIKGHLYTNGSRVVTFATVSSLMDPPTFAISGKVSNASGGAGIPNATVYFSNTANPSSTPIATATTDLNGNYSKSLPNGTWYVAASAPNFFTSSDQIVTLSGYPAPNTNISLTSAITITASAGTGGSISPSGSVLLASGANQTFTITASGGYSISNVAVDGVNQGSLSTYTFTNVTANHTIAATFSANSRNIPQTASLLASCVTDTLPASGATGDWASYLPAGSFYTAMASPTVGSINSAKSVHNLYSDGDGFRVGSYTTPISINGASIVMVVKPTRNGIGTSWTSCFDVMYDRLVLGVKNDTGLIIVRRMGGLDTSATAIPDGQVTVLSLVVQPSGTYRVYANGTLMMDITSTSSMTSFDPKWNGGGTGYWSQINIGRNDPDGWTVFNGEIGDAFLYKIALTDTDRQALEADLTSRFGAATNRTITASAGTGGSISPSGTVSVPNGNSATFVALPNIGYAVSQMTVDGVNQGAISSYTFSNVTANHTISVSFSTVTTYTITASAGSNGTISPSGSVVVNSGTSKTFTITPNAGYQVSQVTVDSANQGAITSYTFNNITANHTISATFTAMVNTITASAATGGSISPSGAVSVNYGANQTFTITPNANYAISSVVVDGTDVGAVSSYTFNSVIAAHTISAVFIAGARNIPAADKLLCAVDTKDLPSSGAISSWPLLWPTGSSLSTIANPTATTVGSVKWSQNRYADGDGYQLGSYSSDIPVNGASIVTAVKPIRSGDSGNWRSIVDVFYNEFCLCITNDTGQIGVRRKGSMDWAPGGNEIPDGQVTVLSYVAQPDGTYKVWANGTKIMDVSTTSTLTALSPLWNGGGTGYWSQINVGRNSPDGWTVFNGDINDVFLYKVALTDDQRLRLEADMNSKLGLGTSTFTITASAGTGGTISPSGAVQVNSGANQTFTITANGGYAISNVVIDGVSVGVASSYTFTNVRTAHTISATFIQTASFTITASAGTGGTITPSGAVSVNPGANQSFTIAANAGYAISQVTVDGVNQGAISSYTFTNVQADHTISATFAVLQYTITASAGSNGSISPSGAVVVNGGGSQTFNMTPNSGYRVSRVLVDGANVGAVTTYQFTNVTAAHTISVEFISTDFVAYYKFDETSGTSAYDWSGNGKTATLSGSCTWVTGKTNNAVNIPGGTSYVGMPSGMLTGLTNWTIALWVKASSVSTNMRIWEFGSSTTNYLSLTPKHANSQGKIQFYIRNTAGTTFNVLGTAALPTGSWQFVVVTQSGNTVTLYVQGAQVGQITNCTLNPNSLGTLTSCKIGDSLTSSYAHLNGIVDGFKIYNRALTSSEVTTLYGSGGGSASFDGDDSGNEVIPADEGEVIPAE